MQACSYEQAPGEQMSTRRSRWLIVQTDSLRADVECQLEGVKRRRQAWLMLAVLRRCCGATMDASQAKLMTCINSGRVSGTVAVTIIADGLMNMNFIEVVLLDYALRGDASSLKRLHGDRRETQGDDVITKIEESRYEVKHGWLVWQGGDKVATKEVRVVHL